MEERVRFFNYRCREEFYDFAKDPDAHHNLIHEPEYQEQIARYKKLLSDYMKETEDPVLPAYETFQSTC